MQDISNRNDITCSSLLVSIIKIIIVTNAIRLGWSIDLTDDGKSLVLKKRSEMLNALDNDTTELVRELMSVSVR